LSELSRTLRDQEQLVGVLPGPAGMATGFSLLNRSLNFLVPAQYCRRGRMHVAVRIWRVGAGALQGDHQDSAAVNQYIEFLDVPAPRIGLVRVDWDDGRGTVTSPSDLEMLKTMRLAERVLPFPYFDATILGVTFRRSAAYALWRRGGCNQAWRDLLDDLVWLRLFQLSDIVFGMVPQAAIPGEQALRARSGSTDIQSGCGRRALGVGGCFIGYESTFAHELGHIYDRKHVSVRGNPGNDPNYPNYGGSKTSIGEVGIDAGESPPKIYEPRASNDIMSYGEHPLRRLKSANRRASKSKGRNAARKNW
jgi:hypothetical protein